MTNIELFKYENLIFISKDDNDVVGSLYFCGIDNQGNVYRGRIRLCHYCGPTIENNKIVAENDWKIGTSINNQLSEQDPFITIGGKGIITAYSNNKTLKFEKINKIDVITDNIVGKNFNIELINGHRHPSGGTFQTLHVFSEKDKFNDNMQNIITYFVGNNVKKDADTAENIYRGCKDSNDYFAKMNSSENENLKKKIIENNKDVGTTIQECFEKDKLKLRPTNPFQ